MKLHLPTCLLTLPEYILFHFMAWRFSKMTLHWYCLAIEPAVSGHQSVFTYCLLSIWRRGQSMFCEMSLVRRVYKIGKSNLLASLFLSICPHGTSRLPLDIFMKFSIWISFKKLSIKFRFTWNLTRITGTLHEDLCTFMIISHSVLLRMRNVSDKIRVNQDTPFMFSKFLLKFAIYEIMQKNMVEPDWPHMTI